MNAGLKSTLTEVRQGNIIYVTEKRPEVLIMYIFRYHCAVWVYVLWQSQSHFSRERYLRLDARRRRTSAIRKQRHNHNSDIKLKLFPNSIFCFASFCVFFLGVAVTVIVRIRNTSTVAACCLQSSLFPTSPYMPGEALNWDCNSLRFQHVMYAFVFVCVANNHSLLNIHCESQ